MYDKKFTKIMKYVFKDEAGFIDDPDDKGGRTNMGIMHVYKKSLADKFLVVESTAKTEEQSMDTTMEDVLKQILKLSQSQRMTIVRKVVGG